MPYILPWKKSEMILALAGARLSPGLLPYHHPPVKAAPTDRVESIQPDMTHSPETEQLQILSVRSVLSNRISNGPLLPPASTDGELSLREYGKQQTAASAE